jgi:hypothetical protein
VNQSRLFDPFVKSHGSFVPLVILTVATSLLSIIAIEFLNHLVYQEAENIVKGKSVFPLKNTPDRE